MKLPNGCANPQTSSSSRPSIFGATPGGSRNATARYEWGSIACTSITPGSAAGPGPGARGAPAGVCAVQGQGNIRHAAEKMIVRQGDGSIRWSWDGDVRLQMISQSHVKSQIANRKSQITIHNSQMTYEPRHGGFDRRALVHVRRVSAIGQHQRFASSGHAANDGFHLSGGSVF